MNDKNEKICETCKFWKKQENRQFGDCRRYSPKVLTARSGEQKPSKWPMTNPTDWCGDYKKTTGSKTTVHAY